MLLDRLHKLLILLLLPAIVLAAPGSAFAMMDSSHVKSASKLMNQHKASTQHKHAVAGFNSSASQEQAPDCHAKMHSAAANPAQEPAPETPSCCELPCCQIMALTIAPLIAQPVFVPAPAISPFTLRLAGGHTGGLERPPRTTSIG